MFAEWKSWLSECLEANSGIFIETKVVTESFVTFTVDGSRLLKLLMPGADGNDFWTLSFADDTFEAESTEISEKETEWIEAVNEEYFKIEP